MTFGEFLSAKRLEKNMSVRAFADLLDISSSYLCEIEKGVRSAPSYEILLRICDVLSLNVDDTYLLLDLAAHSKSRPTVAEDIVDYICDNAIVYRVLRTAVKNDVDVKIWKEVLKLVVDAKPMLEDTAD